MEVDKQLKFKSHQRMQVEFISNNVDVMTHDCLSSVALVLEPLRSSGILAVHLLGLVYQCYFWCALRATAINWHSCCSFDILAVY